MKTVFAFLVFAVVLLALGNTAQASATNWMFYVQVGSPDDTDQGIYNQIGVKPLATDYVDTSYEPVLDLSTAGGTEKIAAQQIDAITDTIYQRDFMSTAAYTTYPSGKKWSFRVAGLSGANTATGIKMVFKTPTTTALAPPQSVPGMWGYWLKLVNARGQTIPKPAWAGGGTWAQGEFLELTMPTSTSTLFAQVDLPTIRLTANAPQNMLSQGYEFEIIQPIPEPGSLLALSAGLIGLTGLIVRRRRG